ncbi:MAG: hypothetical protein A2Y23_05925 [Clostridiales bacterium GWB2_37_7]|nr:MAG: hypothetical protein A2Y23_05925 [Clostridiales bacterium GWB2_37_7]
MGLNSIVKRRIYTIVLCALIPMLLLVYFTNLWLIRDHITPSSNKDLELDVMILENTLYINYKWIGYKEDSTLADYIVVEYEPSSIEFIKTANVLGYSIQQINQVLPYLGGDEFKYSDDIAKLIIPLEKKVPSEAIQLTIESKKVIKPIMEVYYIHVVSLPMDNPSGWIKKNTFKDQK